MYYSSHGQYNAVEDRDPLHKMITRANRYPVLEPEEEKSLISRWHETNDMKAADKLIQSHFRLVAKIASGYRGYGLPMQDLVSEGSLGLMEALRRFDQSKEVRFATYAVWWIQAQMKDYILRNWSMVKMGTNRDQKKLFFSLRRMKKDMAPEEIGTSLTEDQTAHVSKVLSVSKKSVKEMEQRLMGGDISLNLSTSNEDDDGELMDFIPDGAENPEDVVIRQDRSFKKIALLEEALTSLKPREQTIVRRRKMKEKPDTLDTLGAELNLSRERVRQLEVQALKKLEKAIRRLLPSDQPETEFF